MPAEPGLFRLRPEIEQAVAEGLPPACRTPVRFMLEVEISTIYKKADKTRKVHHLIYAPDFATADRISERLARIGNIASDGRPILGLDSRDLLEITLTSSPDAYLVPAHIWTPWFAALGSQSGFDSIADCYGDLRRSHLRRRDRALVRSADELAAVDARPLPAGLQLRRPLAAESSAAKRRRSIARLDYFAIRQALETGQGFVGTVEFFPEEGKYHLDGHRKCGVKLSPRETLAQGGRCPVCGGAMTVGVLSRVETLADRSEAEAAAAADGRRRVEPRAAAGDARRDRRQRTVEQDRRARLRPAARQRSARSSTFCRRVPLEDIARAGSSAARRSRGAAARRQGDPRRGL